MSPSSFAAIDAKNSKEVQADSPADSELTELSEMEIDTVPEVPILDRTLANLRRPATEDSCAFWYCSYAKWQDWLRDAQQSDKPKKKTARNNLFKFDAAGRIMETSDGKVAPHPCRWCRRENYDMVCMILRGEGEMVCAYCKRHGKGGCNAGRAEGSDASDDGIESDEGLQRVSALESLVSELQHNFEKLQESHEELQDDHRIYKNGWHKLQEELFELDQEYDKLREELVSLQKFHQDLQEGDQAELREDYHSLREDHQSLREDYESLREDQQALQATNRALEVELDGLKQRMGTHDRWLEWFKSNYYTATRDIYIMWMKLWPTSARAPPDQPAI
ncbi:hypothetical protein CB0940_08166 [Cercospora beticola]|uniref:Uncharacterized protein n=1 Tax=Cercospora beticola TaxID=122368 RepID=A0A2G5HPX0_CERBT|nr:hypothetical protein CB0940_08166 [Cercospora beticola]PIA94591.1 hypothetical protein CB0940_08166 [Cercospora beticola]WPB04732.1 hypothetical protein RHO25_009379 [Cercospora beticola]